jgi:hypothetical protein
MGKKTGIGGIFFKSHNKGADLAAWYEKHLGPSLESSGGSILGVYRGQTCDYSDSTG